MIIIDGRASELSIQNFANLEELLISVTEGDDLDNRVVTDVLVNKEQFSELYPHQAEDIASNELESVEIRSISVDEMAGDILTELVKVTNIMAVGSRRIASLFRQADDDEALEVLQDLLEVSRDFMNMIAVLRNCFNVASDPLFMDRVQRTSELLTEMCDTLENEDWILLADLLEFEYVPVCESWQEVINTMHKTIA